MFNAQTGDLCVDPWDTNPKNCSQNVYECFRPDCLNTPIIPGAQTVDCPFPVYEGDTCSIVPLPGQICDDVVATCQLGSYFIKGSCSDVDYIKETGMTCDPADSADSAVYPSVSAAQDDCSRISNCVGVTDEWCDSKEIRICYGTMIPDANYCSYVVDKDWSCTDVPAPSIPNGVVTCSNVPHMGLCAVMPNPDYECNSVSVTCYRGRFEVVELVPCCHRQLLQRLNRRHILQACLQLHQPQVQRHHQPQNRQVFQRLHQLHHQPHLQLANQPPHHPQNRQAYHQHVQLRCQQLHL
eukprot:UN30326